MQDLGLDDRGRGEDAHPVLAEVLGQRAVVELGDDLRPDVLGVEPLLQRAPHAEGAPGQQERRAVEGARETCGAVAAASFGRGEEGRAALAEQVVEGADREPGPRGPSAMTTSTRWSASSAMNSSTDLSARQMTWTGLAEPKRRLQEPPHQRRGQDVGDADHQPQRLAAGARPLSVSTNSRPSEKISSA